MELMICVNVYLLLCSVCVRREVKRMQSRAVGSSPELCLQVIPEISLVQRVLSNPQESVLSQSYKKILLQKLQK